MTTTLIEVDLQSLYQPVPVQPFVHATLWALSVLAGQAPFDGEDCEGAQVPSVPKTHPVNQALLALQSSLGGVGLPIELRLAAVQRFLALINSNVAAPELSHLVGRDESGQVTGLSATLIAGAACAPLDATDPQKAEFDVELLAQAAATHGGEIVGAV